MNIELQILETLDAAYPRLLKTSVLRAETRFALDDMTVTDFNRVIARLDEKGQIRLHTGEDVIRVAITDKGRERVAAAR